MSIRSQVQTFLEEELPRVLGILILSYLEEKEVYTHIWGKETGEFGCPGGIAAARSYKGKQAGFFYEIVVTDTGNNCIHVFNSQGELLRTWGKQGTKVGEFQLPCGVSVLHINSTYEVIVADTYNNRIQVFSSRGKFLRMWGKWGSKPGEFNYPRGIALSSSGEVIVVDTSNHRIQVFSRRGRFLRMWGAQGEEPGNFNFPRGATSLPSGEIIVADTHNHRIQVFGSEGKFLRMLENREGGFFHPFGVTLRTSLDELIIADTRNYCIKVFSLEGKFLRMWGKRGKEPGEFDFPCYVISLPSGEIIVSDSDNHRMQVFRTLLD